MCSFAQTSEAKLCTKSQYKPQLPEKAASQTPQQDYLASARQKTKLHTKPRSTSSARRKLMNENKSFTL